MENAIQAPEINNETPLASEMSINVFYYHDSRKKWLENFRKFLKWKMG